MVTYEGVNEKGRVQVRETERGIRLVFKGLDAVRFVQVDKPLFGKAVEFSLTVDQFMTLTNQPCDCCGKREGNGIARLDRGPGCTEQAESREYKEFKRTADYVRDVILAEDAYTDDRVGGAAFALSFFRPHDTLKQIILTLEQSEDAGERALAYSLEEAVSKNSEEGDNR